MENLERKAFDQWPCPQQMLPSQGPEVTPRTSRWPDRACTEQVIKVTARLSTTRRPSQTCGQLPAPPARASCPRLLPAPAGPAPQHRAFPASAAAIYRAEPLVLGGRWKPAVPDRIWGAGRIQLQEQGGLKRGDLSSYPNLLVPLAFGVNSHKTSSYFLAGREGGGEMCFISHCFPPFIG